MNPADLGYFEKRAGSSVWYLPDRGGAFSLRVCANPDCGQKFIAERRSDPQKGRFCSNSCAKRSAEPGYQSRHIRIYKSRGKASDHACVDCPNQAAHWSQVHGTDGTQPEHYEPRCAKCHRAYDAETHARGEKSVHARLTEARVRAIRASVDENGNQPPSRELAEIHGVTRQIVDHVRSRRTWKHITGGRKADW